MTLVLLVAAALAQIPAVPPAPAPPPPPPWAPRHDHTTPPPLVRILTPPPPKAAPPHPSAAATLVGTDREMIRSYDTSMSIEGRRKVAGEVWQQIEALRRHYARRLAGIYFDSDGALVLRLLGARRVADRQLIGPSGVLPVRFRAGWRLTDREVLMKLQPALPELRRRLPGMTGAAVDERTGALFVTVPGYGRNGAAQVRAKEAELTKLLGTPVRIGVFGSDGTRQD